jgi:hypothetical protein
MSFEFEWSKVLGAGGEYIRYPRWYSNMDRFVLFIRARLHHRSIACESKSFWSVYIHFGFWALEANMKSSSTSWITMNLYTFNVIKFLLVI